MVSLRLLHQPSYISLHTSAFIHQISPMQLVTPRLVAIAVKMAIIVWIMNFQVSFFIAFWILYQNRENRFCLGWDFVFLMSCLHAFLVSKLTGKACIPTIHPFGIPTITKEKHKKVLPISRKLFSWFFLTVLRAERRSVGLGKEWLSLLKQDLARPIEMLQHSAQTRGFHGFG